MSKVKELRQIEEAIFDIVIALHTNLQYKNKERYQLALASLDLLNDEYNVLTGNFYLHPLKVLCYYEKQWSI